MATIYEVLATHTVNEGRDRFNSTDASINEELISLHSDFDTHIGEGSTDHDILYPRHAAVDAAIDAVQTALDTLGEEVVKLTGAQEVAGKKTLTTNPEIKPGTTTAEIILRSLYGTERQSKIADWSYADYHALVLAINAGTIDTPDWKQLLFAKNTDLIARFVSDVYSNNKKLATENYVQGLVKSGIYMFETSMRYVLAGTAYINFTPTDGHPKRFMVPKDSRLMRASFAFYDTTNFKGGQYDIELDTRFSEIESSPADIMRLIFQSLEFVAVDGGYNVILHLTRHQLHDAEDYNNDLIISETIDKVLLAGTYDFYLTLMLSI